MLTQPIAGSWPLDEGELMAEYKSNVDQNQAAELLAKARRVVITTHVKPDGDAFGSVVALAAALRGGGAQVSVIVAGPIHESFKSLPGFDLLQPFDADAEWPEVDMLVVLDTGAWSQLQMMRRHIEPLLDRTLIIDHHVSGDVPAKWLCIDSQAAATCQMLGDLVTRLPREDGYLDVAEPRVAEALYIGLASDTGWFRFSNTRPATLELAARLLRAGVDNASLLQKLEQAERVEKLRLLVRALDSLRLMADDRAAMMVLRAEDFTQTGAVVEETERFVDMPQIVGTVELVALVTEPPQDDPGAGDGNTSSFTDANGAIRLSFRSKAGPNAINVARLAQQFGGGGHERAAGAKVVGSLDEVLVRVESAVRAALKP